MRERERRSVAVVERAAAAADMVNTGLEKCRHHPLEKESANCKRFTICKTNVLALVFSLN